MNAANMNNFSETNWERIDAMTEEDIDTSDIPPLDDSFFATAQLRMPRSSTPKGAHFNTETLTSAQAFSAMVQFLEQYYDRAHSDDVAVLVSHLKLLEDGMTVDPATWQDWMNCVHRVLEMKQNVR